MSSIPSNATAAPPVDSIETIFFKATSPIHKSADPNLMNLFCSKVNAEPEGHNQAIRLISHKIQSPQEHEALRTLDLLEVCVQSCGRRFHQEIGKFRFLNEMIKLVSPKYLANHTSERVKKKVIELLYSWTQSLPTEVKINEAYQMLKRQSIVIEDPTYICKSTMTPVPHRNKSIFDGDDEKSKTLQRLLKSRRPEDLEHANALIKTLVKKDEEKIEKLSNRASELERVQNNVRVLTEMLVHYNQSTVTEAEKETMTYLHDELEKLRPVLFRLATEADDIDEGLGDILATSDSVSRVLGQYDRLVIGEPLTIKDDAVLQFMDDVVSPSSRLQPASRTLIDLGDLTTKSNDSSTTAANELDDLFGSLKVTPVNQPTDFGVLTDVQGASNLNPTDDIPPLFPTNLKSNNNQPSASSQSTATSKISTSKSGLFEELQDLLLDDSTGQKISLTKSSFGSSGSNLNKVPMNELISSSGSKSSEGERSFPLVALESIRPSTIYPSITFKFERDTGLRCILHFARDAPRADLVVSVLSVTNTSTSHPITAFNFQAAVPKNMQMKMQTPSGVDLPALNPILPAQAITQIILVSNPNKESIRFRYKIIYSVLGEQVIESGEIDRGFPTSSDLL